MSQGAMRGKCGVFLAELRAPFFTASILPVVLGTTIAWAREEVWDGFLFGLALLGGVLLHAGTNVINDYFDHLTGADEKNRDFVRPFTGGSRLIQSGWLTPKEVLGEAIVLYTLACLIGLYLVLRVGYGVLVLGGVGLLSGILYTFPPLALVSRGLGEVVIGLNFGTLMTLGAYYVQTRHVAWEPVVASLPLALLIAAVVFINQFQDTEADATVGKRHWVVRLGRERAAGVYATMLVFSYMSLLGGVVGGLLPGAAVVALVTLPLAAKAIRVAKAYHSVPQALTPANATTILIHAAVGVLLSGAYILTRIV